MTYRDSKTGHFVSRSTWKRSKAHGGTRYKRTVLQRKRVKERVLHIEWAQVRSGYSGRDKNSYTIEVIMNRRGRTDQQLSNAIEKLCGRGKLNAAAERGDYDGEPVSDLSWATFHNAFSVRPSPNPLHSKRGVRLTGFYRETP